MSMNLIFDERCILPVRSITVKGIGPNGKVEIIRVLGLSAQSLLLAMQQVRRVVGAGGNLEVTFCNRPPDVLESTPEPRGSSG